MLVPGNQEAAHASFQIDRQAHGLIGIADDPVTVFDPPDNRQQIADHDHKQRGTEHANGQGQTDIAAQELAKASLIN